MKMGIELFFLSPFSSTFTGGSPNKRIETDGGKRAVALRGMVIGRRRSCLTLYFHKNPIQEKKITPR
jgi:hypothetical protein